MDKRLKYKLKLQALASKLRKVLLNPIRNNLVVCPCPVEDQARGRIWCHMLTDRQITSLLWLVKASQTLSSCQQRQCRVLVAEARIQQCCLLNYHTPEKESTLRIWWEDLKHANSVMKVQIWMIARLVADQFLQRFSAECKPIALMRDNKGIELHVKEKGQDRQIGKDADLVNLSI